MDSRPRPTGAGERARGAGTVEDAAEAADAEVAEDVGGRRPRRW